MAKYDPDRSTPENRDLSDPEVMSEYLHDPVVEALHDDLGRQFRHAPADTQKIHLLDFIDDTKKRRDEILPRIETEENPTIRLAFEELVDQANGHILAAEQRLRELEE